MPPNQKQIAVIDNSFYDALPSDVSSFLHANLLKNQSSQSQQQEQPSSQSQQQREQDAVDSDDYWCERVETTRTASDEYWAESTAPVVVPPPVPVKVDSEDYWAERVEDQQTSSDEYWAESTDADAVSTTTTTGPQHVQQVQQRPAVHQPEKKAAPSAAVPAKDRNHFYGKEFACTSSDDYWAERVEDVPTASDLYWGERVADVIPVDDEEAAKLAEADRYWSEAPTEAAAISDDYWAM